jgi:hypothetical protein
MRSGAFLCSEGIQVIRRAFPTWETNGSVKDEETELSACSNGSLGWNRTNDQRINRTEQPEPIVAARIKTKA